MSWNKYKLSELLTLIGGGTPKTTNPSYWGGNIPWLSVVDFNNDNRYVYTTEKTITEEGVENSSTKILSQGSLILSARGTVGALAQLAKPMAFNQSCYGIIAKEQTTNDFLYYLLKNVVEDLQAKGHGSVFNTITRDTFDTITVDLPSVEEQHRIAEILGAFDDKIELLQKQNKTLENMAKALFKCWFVDFDVVRAKAALSSPAVISSPHAGEVAAKPKGGVEQARNSANGTPFGPAGTFPARGTEQGAMSGIFPPCGGSGCQAEGGTKQMGNSANNTPLPACGVLSPQGGQTVAQCRVSSPRAGEVAAKPKGGKKEGKHHQFYLPSVKALVRTMRQNLTPQEVKLWQCLRKEQLGVKFRRQFPIDSKYIADFACLEKKLIIELDGSQHAENPLDKERTLYLEDNGFTVLRLWNNEIDKNLMGCLERIRELLNRPHLPAYEENNADNTPFGPAGTFPARGTEQTAWTKEKIMREYHLTEELYNLFPSSFADSPLGPSPSGWEVKPLKDLASITAGKRPKQVKDIKDDNFFIPVYGGNGIKWWTNVSLYSTPIIITGRVGTLGKVYRIYEPVWVSDNALIFEVQKEHFEYLLYMLYTIDFNSFNRGSTQPLITQSDIKEILAVFDQVIVQKFHSIIVEYEKKINNNNRQIQTLTELRDSLLPRLISGKIRV